MKPLHSHLAAPKAKAIARRILPAFLILFAGPAFAGLEWETKLRDVRAEAGEKAISVAFPFRNTGAEPVGISGIQTSCGCTSAKADCKEVPAGGAGSVQVRFDIGNRKGEQVKSVIVRTSDREKYTLVLRVFLPDR
ncbi:MAG: DUF1573 domain-containing protein [Verrucomicrobiae bacterium]